MDKDRFNELVEFTRHIFFDPRRERREVPAKVRADHYKMLSGFEDVQGQLLHDLIADSEKTKLSWDAVSLIAREYHRKSLAYPPELHDWVDDVLAGKRTSPPTGAQAKSERDRQVCIAIEYLVKQFDLPPTRNISQTIDGKKSDWPHCCAEGGSACDVVGKALGEVDCPVGYKTIEGYWTNRDPLLKHPPDHRGEEVHLAALSPQGWVSRGKYRPDQN